MWKKGDWSADFLGTYSGGPHYNIYCSVTGSRYRLRVEQSWVSTPGQCQPVFSMGKLCPKMEIMVDNKTAPSVYLHCVKTCILRSAPKAGFLKGLHNEGL